MFVMGGGLETTIIFKRGIELPLFARNPPTRLRRRHRGRSHHSPRPPRVAFGCGQGRSAVRGVRAVQALSVPG
jgi:hypothetical protein